MVWFNFVAYRFLRSRWNCGSDLLYPLHVSPFLPRARTAKHYGQRRSYWSQHSIRFVLDALLNLACMVDSQAPYSSLWYVCAGLYLKHLTRNNPADIYEVAVIIGSCFIVNYVTADSKTNWAEGVSMIAFYLMIVSRRNPLATFFLPQYL